MNRTRLLLLCEYPTLNGGERSMLATLPHVQAAGFEVAALAPPDGPLAAALAAQAVEVVPFAVRDGHGLHRAQPALREELAEVLRHRRPALLHANSLAMGRLAGPVAAELRLPSLAHLRDIIGLSRQAAADLGANTRLLAVSQATRAYHLANGLPPEKVAVLYNGVDLERFQPRPPSRYVHDALGLPPRAQLAATIGQIGLRKGQDVLLQAAGSLAGQLPDLHWLIIGEAFSAKDEARQFVADVHREAAALGGRVHFLGRRDDVDRLLPELTLLVHPARQEPLGRVLLEAAAAGVPIVATDVGGTAEIFPPATQSAVLIPPDDPAALAAAVARLTGDSAARTRLATAARARAATAFDARQAATGLIAHYRELADADRDRLTEV